jgi:hypothetical protein
MQFSVRCRQHVSFDSATGLQGAHALCACVRALHWLRGVPSGQKLGVFSSGRYGAVLQPGVSKPRPCCDCISIVTQVLLLAPVCNHCQLLLSKHMSLWHSVLAQLNPNPDGQSHTAWYLITRRDRLLQAGAAG